MRWIRVSKERKIIFSRLFLGYHSVTEERLGMRGAEKDARLTETMNDILLTAFTLAYC